MEFSSALSTGAPRPISREDTVGMALQRLRGVVAIGEPVKQNAILEGGGRKNRGVFSLSV